MVAQAPSSITARGDSLFSARLLGFFNATASLIAVVILAQAITSITESHVRVGLAELVAFIGLRWALATGLTEWNYRSSASIRRYWRTSLPDHLTIPASEHQQSRTELALAIDQAAEAPFLEVLSTSGRVAILGLGLVFLAGGWLSVSITLSLLAISIPLYLRAGRRSEIVASEYAKRRVVLEERQLELLRHSTELRSLGAVSYGSSEIVAISESEHAVALRAIRIALESSLITEFLSGVSIGLVAMVVGFALLGGRISLLHALVAVLVTNEIFAQVRRFGVEFHRHEDAVRSAALLSSLPIPSGRVNDLGTVIVETTSLVTQGNSQPISLTVRPGDRVLVTGPSGSGKSTLLATLVGWRPIVSGDATRTAQAIGFVSVSSTLVSGTLRDNLTLNGNFSDDEVRQVLTSLGLQGDRFAELTTELLPDGRGFSTGERVRLILARALLQRPSAIMLDDVAGVLDPLSRGHVRRTIEAYGTLAVIEATVDTPIFDDAPLRIELT